MKKCYKCKKEKEIEKFYVNKGKIYNICINCRKRIYCCPHKKEPRRCKVCAKKNGLRCEHGREKYDCIDCGGDGICQHKKRKRNCVECKGSLICEHNKNRSICKLCEGSQLCEHKIIRYRCKLCQGAGICIHNIFKKICPECDPTNHLLSLQRRRINYILNRGEAKYKKSKTTIEYLGCSQDFLKEYIYSKLTEDMKKYGYEIDHIKPIAKFDFNIDGELEKCCHWSNLQPLLLKDNRKKSDKWSESDEIEWNKMIHVCRQTTKT
jgi:hypothetical protein